MKNNKTLSVAFLFFLLALAGKSWAGEAPLFYLNQFPITQWLNNPYYDTARVKDGYVLSASHSSVYIKNSSSRYDLFLDFEITTLNVLAGKKIGENTEAGVFMPLAMYSSGFLDSFINGFHDTFGFSDYGRGASPDNEFSYIFKKDGKKILNPENGRPFIGDVSVYLKQALFKNNKLASSVRLEADIPTGDAKKGQGSGRYGFGTTFLNDFAVTDRFKLYIDAGVASPGKLNAEIDLETKTFYHGTVAIEYLLPQNYSVIGQISGQTSPIRKTGIVEIDGPYTVLNIGLRKKTGSYSLELMFTEDLNTRGAPDAGLTFAVKIER